MDQNHVLAGHLRTIRSSLRLTLQDLASTSGVSRATLSRIENGEVSPTADTLGRLATAFSMPLSQLLAPLEPRFPPLIRRDGQGVWRDPQHGFRRRLVSPPSRQLRIEMIECTIEPHQRIGYDEPQIPDHEHHLWLLEGALSLTVDDERHELRAGDCLRYRLRGASCFETGEQAARYLIAFA